MSDMWCGVSLPAVTGDDAVTALLEDVALAAELGMGQVVLPLEWARLQPAGQGELAREVVADYRKVLRRVRRAGMGAIAALGGSLPPALDERGGWSQRETAESFAAFAGAVAKEFGRRVSVWLTLQEPWRQAFQPADLTEPGEAFARAHHLSLGHGLASQAIRRVVPNARIAVGLDLHVVHPHDPESSNDLDAVARTVSVANHVFLGPLLEGSYPVALLRETAHVTNWDFVRPGDVVRIRQRIDVIFLHHGAVHAVSAAPGATAPAPWHGLREVAFHPLPPPHTATGAAIAPDTLGELLEALDNTNPDLPMVVVSNAAVFADELTADNRVHDAARVSYLHDHIAEIRKTRTAGVRVGGHVVPLVGAAGIIHQAGERRIPKDSARWYAALARHGELPDPTSAWTLPPVAAGRQGGA